MIIFVWLSQIMPLKYKDMLVEFSVGNFRSFKEIETLSMVASKITSKDKSVDEKNVFVVNDKLSLLKSMAIYGANASGKSNLAKALYFMFTLITSSVRDENFIQVLEKFYLNPENIKEPSFFQIIFIYNEVQYRYGFEINEGRIISEWLFDKPGIKERRLFTRENDEIDVNTRNLENSSGLKDKTKDSALFLTVGAAFNVDLLSEILSFINGHYFINHGLITNIFRSAGFLAQLDNKAFKTSLLELLKIADLGIEDLRRKEEIEELEPIKIGINLNGLQPIGGNLYSKKTIYNSNGDIVSFNNFDFESTESEGTKKLVSISYSIIHNLTYGGITWIDEFDARFHPKITRKIVELYNSKTTNPHNAQLIFITHDSALLDAELLRRDQICLVDKDKYGASTLHNLVEYKGIRNDASYEKDYMKGKYGAVPYLGDFQGVFEKIVGYGKKA